MDFLPDIDHISAWLIHYGSFALFGLLALGIIALPVPEETLMVAAGVLMRSGHLKIPATYLAALGGSITGITVSYILGRTAGVYLIHKYGSWIGITAERHQKVHEWFERFGKWALFIGYFIPGVRHFTGFSAGTSNLEYHHFALFAYTGALVWVTTFISIGYFTGNYWISVIENIELTEDEIVLILFIAFLGVLFYLLKKHKSD